MRPAWSMIFFTTLSGTGQGLFITLAGVDAAQATGQIGGAGNAFFVAGAVLTVLLCGLGLVAATFHLGHPMRAWRAMAMWRSSWLSREVIVLPVFIAVAAGWGLAHWAGAPTFAPGLIGCLLALGLFLCTGMIYGAVAVIREWATPLTPLSFAAMGLASGTLVAAALAAAQAPALAALLSAAALLTTAAAATVRGATLWRNARLVPKTTLQTALGIRHPRIVQTSQGMMGGSFGTREFVHGQTEQAVRLTRLGAALAGFMLPAAVLAMIAAQPGFGVLVLLGLVQWGGLLAERWIFFADAHHPQTLYHAKGA
jgi:sulfite dehydrogenase (quinone) subunit SoeC